MKITSKTWIAVVALLCLAAVLAGNFIVRKMRNYLTNLDSTVAEKTMELDQMKAAIAENEKFVMMWKEISDFQNESPIDRQNKFNAYIHNALTDSKIDYRTVYPPTSTRLETSPNFQVLNFKLSFSTQLAELLDFIIRLDQNPQLLRLENLSIKARTRSPQFSKFTTDSSSPLWNDLTVDMAVSIPAAKPSTESLKQEVIE